MIKYVVRLTGDERSSLTALIDKGKAAARIKIDADGPNWCEAKLCAPWFAWMSSPPN